MHFRAITYLLGWLMLAFGCAQLLPFGVSLLYGDGQANVFLSSAFFAMALGGVAITATRAPHHQLATRDGFLLTVLSWLVLAALGAIPLYYTGAAPTMVDAWFESVSGITTTGATVLVGLDTMDHGVLIWRALLQWLGGMGIIVLAIAVLPFLGIGGQQLFKAELPGVSKDKLTPRLQSTAKVLWLLYVGITVTCIFAYAFVGMPMFDAIAHAFTTVATGGFSTKDASIGAFNNPLLEWVTMFFMVVGAVNFALHFRFMQKPSLKMYWRDEEVRFFLIFIVLAASVFFAVQTVLMQLAPGTALRDAFFSAITVLSTTGYSTTDYAAWAAPAPLIILMLMFVGGVSGSTTGGMKILRLIVLLKLGARELFRLIHPRAIVPVKVGGTRVMPEVQQTIWAFVGVYTLTFMVVALAVNATGVPLLDAIAAAAAAVTCVGPGIEAVGPASTYAHLPQLAKVILSFGMMLGRLEIFTFIILLSPVFWRK